MVDVGLGRLADLVLPVRLGVDRRLDVGDQVLVVSAQQLDQALFLAGELLVEGALRRARVPDDVGDGGVAIAALTDRCGQPVEQPVAERVVDGRDAVVERSRSSFRLPRSPCAALVPSGTVLQTPTVHRSTRETAGSDSPMTDTAVTVDSEGPDDAGQDAARRAPAEAGPGMVLMAGFRRRFLRNAAKRYGPVFAINVPFFGRSVVISDPALVRQVFLASTDDLINVQPNLSRIFGPGSVFALDGKEHRARRKLLAPPFHGQSIKNYEKVIEEETLRETATWPEGDEFRTLEPMNRITLNVILRTVFGADGAELDYLREIIPPWAKLGSRMATLPEPPFSTGPLQPVGPARRSSAATFDRTVFALIDKAEADPRLDERTDILALLLRSRYDDGTPMSRQDVSDELLTLLGRRA